MPEVQLVGPVDLQASAESLLRRHAPQALQQLKGETEPPEPDERITLGGGDENLPTPAEWRRAARYMEKALEVVVEKSVPKVAALRHAMKIADLWQFAAELIAVIGPASIFGVLETSHPVPARYISAGFVLLASMVAVAARYADRSPGTTGTFLDRYKELVDCNAQASALIRQLKLALFHKQIGPEQQDLLSQANDVCRRAEVAIE